MQLESNRIEVTDSIEAIYELVCERGWGDGFPVIPPTEDRVQRMLEQVGREPSEVVGKVLPLGGDATIEKIAINAVMAGCLPEYLPVVIAAVEAMVEPEFNLHGIQTTTNPVGPLVIINGPIRKELNVNCGGNCLGQGWRANATIGRAIRLILTNIGGGLPQTVDKAVHGMPGKYSSCFGENEEESPWEPLHVERGFDKEQSTVTVVGAHGTLNVATVFANWRTWIELAANAIIMKGNNTMHFGKISEPLVVLTSGHASVLANEGLSKADGKRLIFEQAWLPESEMPADSIAPGEILVVDGKVLPCKQADDIMIVVAGSAIPYHLVVMSTFGHTKAVTKPIRTKGKD